jgi:hypothetical protein
VRIRVFGRRIKRWMDAPDQPIPLHLSEVFWSDGSGSNGRIRRGRGAHHRPRVPARVHRRCGQVLDAGEVLDLPEAGEQVDEV